MSHDGPAAQSARTLHPEEPRPAPRTRLGGPQTFTEPVQPPCNSTSISHQQRATHQLHEEIRAPRPG
jgi:hypothetical protein